MKQGRPTRPKAGSRPTKAERETLAGYDSHGLQEWTNKTLLQAVRSKANDIRYVRGKDGLTVQFRKGSKVLETKGPFKRYQDKVIPRLVKMGQQGLPKRLKGETGRFRMMIDDRDWNCPVFYRKTKSGERMAVRFTSSKPSKGLSDARKWVNLMLLRAIAMKATAARFESSKDGLALQYLRGTKVVFDTGGPTKQGAIKRIWHKVIPRLKKMAKMDPAKKGKRQTGKYEALVDGREWDFRMTSTATKSGERMVVRFNRQQPRKGRK